MQGMSCKLGNMISNSYGHDIWNKTPCTSVTKHEFSAAHKESTLNPPVPKKASIPVFAFSVFSNNSTHKKL